MESRLNAVLERLLRLPSENLQLTLVHATDLIAEALRADKVDAFLYRPESDTLVAVGSSNQPLSMTERRHGLDRLQLSNGGRVVGVFKTGETFVTGDLQHDPEEIRGVKEVLKIRSKIGVPLEVGGKRVGMIMIASLQPDFFTPDDVKFAEVVCGWVGVVAHRAELVGQIAKNAAERGRRAVAEELVTVLAHDLRNHLAPIGLRLHMLLRRAERETRLADVADATHGVRSLERLEAMVGDILDVARLDRGVFNLDVAPVELVPMLEEVAGTLATPEQPVLVKASSRDVTVPADPSRIRQCVENLLSNATRHSPKGAPVTVLVSLERADEGERARVDVIDEGPGVPEDVLPHIFDRFVTGQPQGGLGLGLYIAKRIAVLHRGDLTVESGVERGARFRLTLPVTGDLAMPTTTH